MSNRLAGNHLRPAPFFSSLALIVFVSLGGGLLGPPAYGEEEAGALDLATGQVLLEVGDIEGARDAFIKAMGSKDADVRASAREGLAEAVELIQPIGSAQLAVGRVLLEAGDVQSALAQFLDAAKSSDATVSSAARQAIADALQIDPVGKLSLSIGEVLEGGGAWEEALDIYSQAARSSDPIVAEAGRQGVARVLSEADPGSDHLALGRIHRSVGDWDAALSEFLLASASNDEAITVEAFESIEQVVHSKNADALGIRSSLPQPFNRWVWIDYIVYAFAGLVAFFLLRMLLSSRPVRWFTERLFKPRRKTARWRARLSGEADQALRSLVLDEFVVTMRDLRRDGASFRRMTAVGPHEARFFVPLSLSDLVGPDLVVQGVDLSWLASVFQKLIDHFTYQFLVRVETYDGSPYVFATLSWGGHAEQSWQIPRVAEEADLCYRGVGRALAHSVYGDELRKT